MSIKWSVGDKFETLVARGTKIIGGEVVDPAPDSKHPVHAKVKFDYMEYWVWVPLASMHPVGTLVASETPVDQTPPPYVPPPAAPLAPQVTVKDTPSVESNEPTGSLSDAILSFVKDNPGSGKATICAAVNVGEGRWNPTITKLVAEGLIVRDGHSRGAVYYTPGTEIPYPVVRTATAAKNGYSPTVTAVKEYVAANPGTSRSAICTALGIEVDGWVSIQRVLAANNLVRITGAKRGTRYYPADEET